MLLYTVNFWWTNYLSLKYWQGKYWQMPCYKSILINSIITFSGYHMTDFVFVMLFINLWNLMRKILTNDLQFVKIFLCQNYMLCGKHPYCTSLASLVTIKLLTNVMYKQFSENCHKVVFNTSTAIFTAVSTIHKYYMQLIQYMCHRKCMCCIHGNIIK